MFTSKKLKILLAFWNNLWHYHAAGGIINMGHVWAVDRYFEQNEKMMFNPGLELEKEYMRNCDSRLSIESLTIDECNLLYGSNDGEECFTKKDIKPKTKPRNNKNNEKELV